ncbi:MAG: hypothetical protein WEE36_07215 [Acidimicrobiia bacterium]
MEGGIGRVGQDIGAGRRLGRDVSAAIVAFLVVFAVGYVAGRVAMPVFRSALGEIELPSAGEGGAGEVSVVAMRADLAPFERPVALLQASGAVDGRVLLDHGETQGGFFLRDDFEEGSVVPIDVNVRFSGSGAVLTLIADQMPVDEPRSEGMTVVLTSGGQTFNAARGACTLELIDSGYKVVSRPWGELLTPHFAGHLACGEVAELRSGSLVSFVAVFDYTVEH